MPGPTEPLNRLQALVGPTRGGWSSTQSKPLERLSGGAAAAVHDREPPAKPDRGSASTLVLPLVTAARTRGLRIWIQALAEQRLHCDANLRCATHVSGKCPALSWRSSPPCVLGPAPEEVCRRAAGSTDLRAAARSLDVGLARPAKATPGSWADDRAAPLTGRHAAQHGHHGADSSPCRAHNVGSNRSGTVGLERPCPAITPNCRPDEALFGSLIGRADPSPAADSASERRLPRIRTRCPSSRLWAKVEHVLHGSPAHRAERGLTQPRPSKPDPDHAGAGSRESHDRKLGIRKLGAHRSPPWAATTGHTATPPHHRHPVGSRPDAGRACRPCGERHV